jgi:predicted PurR-regulated permease PerM
MRSLAYTVVALGGILALLIIGESSLIPLIYGIVLCFIIYLIKGLLEKIPLVKDKMPGWLLNLLAFAIVFVAISFVSTAIIENISQLSTQSATYQSNFEKVMSEMSAKFGVDLNNRLSTYVQEIDYAGLLRGIADGLSSTVGNIVMILLYAMFIISEEGSLKKKIRIMSKNAAEHNRTLAIAAKISEATESYIRLKTYLSLLTGIIGYVFLWIMGVDGAVFWAFLLFALNYIPTIGSLAATLFPAVFSLLQFGEIGPFLIILVGLGLIEWVIGNVLEPRIMGKSLNLSPLVTILALVFWGQIWGITGMLLSTPISVIMLIVFSQFEHTKQVAILLSKDGDVEHLE